MADTGSNRTDGNVTARDRDDTARHGREDDARGQHHDDRGDVYPDEPRRGASDVRTLPAKTSAAATFALIFGLSALICVLSVLLSPVGLVLGIIGIIVGVAGLKMTGRVGVTGRALAMTGLVMSVIAVLLSLALAAGVTTFLNDENAVERFEQQVSDLRNELPDSVNVPTP